MSMNSLSRLRRSSRLLVAVLIERLALDVLHDQISLAVVRLAGIHQPRDVRMIQARENLPLGAEAHAEICGSCAVDYFDCNLARELFVGALAEEHRTRAAAAEHRDQLILGDDASDE